MRHMNIMHFILNLICIRICVYVSYVRMFVCSVFCVLCLCLHTIRVKIMSVNAVIGLDTLLSIHTVFILSLYVFMFYECLGLLKK